MYFKNTQNESVIGISGMESILNDSVNDFTDSKHKHTGIQSIIANLSERIWSIDLSAEPYQIIYHNKPSVREEHVLDFPYPSSVDTWQKLIHEADRDRILDEVVNALSTGYASYSYRLTHDGKTYRYYRDRLHVYYENDRPIRLDCITIDIDKIRRSRLSLELSQQRLKSIVDALPDPVFISTQKDGKVIFANEVLFEVYGMKPADFLGKKVIQFYDNFAGRRSYLEKLSNEGHVQNHELLLKNRNGESFWVSASTTPLDFQNQESFITILQDVTIRKNLEKDIKESNERYRLAVEGANDAIWEYDFETKFSYMSPQFWDGIGFPPEENPLNDQLIAKYLHEEDVPEFLSALSKSFKDKEEELTLELRFDAAEYKSIWALFKAKIIYVDNKPVRAVGSLSNITSLKVAQSRLKESEAKYKLISENSSDCICLQTISGKFVFVSPSSKDILGYSPKELQSLKLRDIISNKDLHKVSDAMMEVILGKLKSNSVVFQAKHKEGHLEWLETIGGAIFDESGEAQYLQTSTRNVTDRVMSQQRLKESEERYKLITENSHDIVTLMNMEGDYVFITPSIKDTMGYEPEEIIGRNTSEFIHPDDLPMIQSSMGEAIQERRREGYAEFRFRRKDGEWRWIQVTGGVIVDDKGEPIYIRSNKIDITEKKLTEEKLKRQEERYKLVSENSGDVIGLHKLDGNVVFISPSVYRLLNYESDEKLEGHPFNFIHKDDAESVEKIFLDTVSKKRKDAKTSYRIRNKQGDYIWVGVSLSTVLNESGEVEFVVSSTRDITEIVKVIEKERQLNKLKSSFISMASHEFRTPLTTIQSSNELISMYMDNSEVPTDKKLAKHVGRIRTELERLNSLLKDVFTLGRLDVGKTRLKKDITSLTSIVKQVILESSVPFKDRHVELIIKGEERQTSLDSQLISHALANLVNNALKYSQGKKDPEVTIYYKPDIIIVEVTDYGMGIPLKDQQGLFESFSRASNVGDIEGTGLGLVIVKQFIEMHGGDVEFTTELNKGTTFRVLLPET